ncbi:sugar kinase, partial [bacterium]|nr:sugar kinase [bacterium]
MSILVVGSVAYDTVETPREKRERQLGGSASFFSLAAIRFAPVRAVGVVGDDFRQEDLDLLASRGVDIAGIVRASGETFHWSGRYHDDMIERDTLATELGVFQDFQPVLPDDWAATPYLFLANIHPALQEQVLDSVTAPKLVVLDTMNLWIDTTRDALASVLR